MRLGAIQVRDGHHGEQPKSVMRLGALRSCQESSRVEEEGTETVAKGCHETSVEAQPDPSRESAQRATRRKRKTRWQLKTKGQTSEEAKGSHSERKGGSKEGTRGRRNHRMHAKQVSRTYSNEGVARLSGGGCHGRHARKRSGATWEVSKGPHTRASRVDRQRN